MIADKAPQSHIGVGLYSVADALNCRSPSSRIYRWLEPESGLVSLAFNPSEHTITFQELMELHFIKIFRDAGVTFHINSGLPAEAASKNIQPLTHLALSGSTRMAMHFCNTNGEGRKKKSWRNCTTVNLSLPRFASLFSRSWNTANRNRCGIGRFKRPVALFLILRGSSESQLMRKLACRRERSTMQ